MTRRRRAFDFGLTPPTKRFVVRLMLAVPSGVLLLFATSLWEIGWDGFTTHLMHPKTQSNSFDLLAASLGGGLAVLMAATVATLAIAASVTRLTVERRKRLEQFVGSWMWFWIGTLLMYSLAVMASSAYGFPRYSSAVLVQATLSVLAWFCLIMLNARGAAMVLRQPPHRSGASRAHEQTAARENQADR